MRRLEDSVWEAVRKAEHSGQLTERIATMEFIQGLGKPTGQIQKLLIWIQSRPSAYAYNQLATDAYAALELERHDISYRQPVAEKPSKYEPAHVCPRPLSAAALKRRDSIMYHAGRYSEGARDAEATQAAKDVKKFIKAGK